MIIRAVEGYIIEVENNAERVKVETDFNLCDSWEWTLISRGGWSVDRPAIWLVSKIDRGC